MNEQQGAYIVRLEAKDLWLAGHYKKGVGSGYNLYTRSGKLNYNKFKGALDYSLDFQKLQKVYVNVYRRRDFVVRHEGSRYVKSIISVDFNYSVKEFNRVAYLSKYTHAPADTRVSVYVKIGYDYNDLTFNDSVAFDNGELVGVVVNNPVEHPLDEATLGKSFKVEDGVYKTASISTAVSVTQLREWIYENGFVCDNRKYIRYKRSNGSSRLGKCLFIDERLYHLMDKWQRCGLKPEQSGNFDLAAYEAYISLPLSSIIGTVRIKPENILLIKDFESVFTEKMIVTRDVNGELHSQAEEHEVHNSIWDGQSLMDTSLFAGYEDRGMLLLRNRFFKSCCFHAKIQEWFRDNGITEVGQLNGYTTAKRVSDIKLITTPSSIKYLKFGTMTNWLQRLDPSFGIVKHEKSTHLLGGKLVQTHYQLINTLQMSKEEVEALTQPTAHLLESMNEDPAVVKLYNGFVRRDDVSDCLCTKNDLIYNAMNVTDRFSETKLYEDFKFELIQSIKDDMKSGKILVHGNYSVLCGNPVEMLRAAIGKFDGTSQIGVGNIFCKNFGFNQTILGSRSPHVCASNIYLAANAYNEEIDRYFNLSQEIVAVNSIGESLLDRLSGSDFDSDSCLLTDNEILIQAAQKNYHRFLVPTSAVSATKRVRKYSLHDLADLDTSISRNKIGEIVNLAQILTTKFFTNVNTGQSLEENEEIYNDIVTLDVLSGIEIDKAKKEFDVDTAKELDQIRKKWLERDEGDRVIMPKFLGYIASKKGYYDDAKKNYTYHQSSMEYVQQVVRSIKLRHRKDFLKLSEVFTDGSYDFRKVNYATRNSIMAAVDQFKRYRSGILLSEDVDYEIKRARIADAHRKLLEFVENKEANDDTVVSLLRVCESQKPVWYRSPLFNILCNPRTGLLQRVFKARQEVNVFLEPSYSGEIVLFDTQYKRIKK